MKKELQNLIEKSELNDEDKKIWFSVIQSLNDKMTVKFHEVILTNPDNLPQITSLIKEFQEAIGNKDLAKIDKLLEK
ncbi:MAG: hypothetical protein ABH833_02480 [Parcubacteria group bacterium]